MQVLFETVAISTCLRYTIRWLKYPRLFLKLVLLLSFATFLTIEFKLKRKIVVIVESDPRFKDSDIIYSCTFADLDYKIQQQLQVTTCWM